MMRFIDFVICDDIRYEMGNKHSLIGLYDEHILFNVPHNETGKWPKALKLGVFLRAKFDNEGERAGISKFRLESSLNNNTKLLAEGGFTFDPKTQARGINVAIVMNQFIFEDAGALTFKFTFFDKSNSVMQVFESPDPIKIAEVVV